MFRRLLLVSVCLGFLSLASRQALATKRVGQQVLQGLDLAPSALLCCLHDTGLEPPHIAFDVMPAYGMPFSCFVGGCTRRTLRPSVWVGGCSLICFSSFDRFAKFSRVERPNGSLLAFARGMFHPLSP